MIRHASFEHGWYYHYRVHNKKAELLNNGFDPLKNYLYHVFDNCPHEYFERGPRGSRLRFKISIQPKEITGHEISLLTRYGLENNEGRYNSDHSKVQVFMLENDNKTIAVEVPLWLKEDEMEDYREILKTKEPLTGHIDLLRIEDDNIWVWDYKPNAHKEEYATTQTYFYALMLSKRTGISLDRIRCGYFDSYYAYVFKPEPNAIVKTKPIRKFF
ncbi:MAG: PD-(D/E)XK nuclease family protein [Candidatus Nanoarchaeia archaeon]